MITHSKKDIYYFYRYLLIGIIPLLLHGFYKNSYLVYKEYKSIGFILNPLILLLGFTLIGTILDKIKYKSFKPNKNICISLIVFLLLPVSLPLWLYVVALVLTGLLLFFDKEKINVMMVVKLAIVLILFLLHKYGYANSIESTGNYIYSFLDLITRSQIGGFGTSNLILVVTLTIYLLFNVIYKKNISMLGVVTYAIICLIATFFITPSVALKDLIRSSVIFELIIVASFNQYSPYTILGQKVFGILVGLLGGLLCILLPFEGVSITILLLSIFKDLFDKIHTKNK